MTTIGSIVHGAYGDYYEQLLGLRCHKQANPDSRLVLFFADEVRRRELAVFDLSFADEIHDWPALAEVPVDRFVQFQVRDAELQQHILAQLPARVLSRLDTRRNLKPWQALRTLYQRDPAACQLELSPRGREQLPACMRENEIDPRLFDERFTVGFLWRHRGPGGAISSNFQTAAEVLRRNKSELFRELIERHGAHVLICGMNLRVTEENRRRVDAKFTDQQLDLPADGCTYLKGLSWGLELQILSRCDLCLMMPSGFSEALWLKQPERTILLDAPPHYLAKLLWNRMPLFGLWQPRELFFQLRQPHSAERVLAYLNRRGLLRPRPKARPDAALPVAVESSRER